MTGAVVAAIRPTRAVRTTIPVRALGGWNFDSGSSNPSLGAVSESTLDVMSATPVGIRLILQNVLQGQCPHQRGIGASWSKVPDPGQVNFGKTSSERSFSCDLHDDARPGTGCDGARWRAEEHVPDSAIPGDPAQAGDDRRRLRQGRGRTHARSGRDVRPGP